MEKMKGPIHATSTVLVFQEWALKITGFMPLEDICSPRKRLTAFTLHCVSVSILIGTLFSVTLYMATLFWGLFGPNAVPSAIGNPLIEWLTYIPYCFTNLRGCTICSIFWYHNNTWKRIKFQADELFQASVPGPRARRVLVRRWRNVSIVFGVVAIILVCSWETNSWIHYQDQDPQRYDFNFNKAVDPLPMPMTVWQYVITWTFWSTLPFCLSQEIYITLIMLAWMLNRCVQNLNDAIIEEREYYRQIALSKTGEFLRDDKFAMKELASRIRDRITVLRHRRMKMVTYCEDLNHTYGLIIFAIYGLDIFTVCGFVAGIVANTEPYLSAYALNAWSVVLYGSYATIFMIPMVLVYEKGYHTTLNLHRLIDAAATLIEQPEGHQLRIALKTFLTASKDQLLIFHGAELLHVTRNLIAGTFTFMFSCVVIMHEILLHSKAAAGCEKLTHVLLAHPEGAHVLQSALENLTMSGHGTPDLHEMHGP